MTYAYGGPVPEPAPAPRRQPNDEMRLAVAAGRLFQAVRERTVLQMDEAEMRAWAAFTSALGDQHHTGCPVHTVDRIDAVRYVGRREPAEDDYSDLPPPRNNL